MRQATVPLHSLRVRQLDEVNTEVTVEVDDFEHLPEEYANEYLAMTAGDVVFLETYGSLGHVVWRVECLAKGLYATGRIAYDEARKEARSHR